MTTFMQECLKEALTIDQRKSGMYLEEDADHFLLLRRGTHVLAVFPQSITIDALRETAEKFI